MRTPTNPFKQAIASPGVRVGLWVGLADPYAAELCANAGFDWLLLDGEHGPNDLRSLLGTLQAVAPYPSHPVVRIPQIDTALIKQVLEIGATTLLVPMVESANHARHIVQAMRYPPRGVRGVGSGLARSSRWSGYPNYLHEADDSLCLLVQVETVSALSQLDEIAAVDGVHGDWYYTAQLVDMQLFNFAYLGTRSYGNDGGDFLIAGPHWRGDQPKGVKAVIRSETQFAYALIRTQLFNATDLDNVHRIQDGYKVQPLSKYLGTATPPAAPAIDWPRPSDRMSTSLEMFG